MTIQVVVKNNNQGGEHNVRVHRVIFPGPYVEDGIILKPGEEREFTIWRDVKLAIEEEYHVVTRKHSDSGSQSDEFDCPTCSAPGATDDGCLVCGSGPSG